MALQTINNIALNLTDNRPGDHQHAFIWAHGLMFCSASDVESGLFAWKHTEQNHRLVRYDARGHGESEVTPLAEDYQWTGLAKDMLAVAEQTGAKRIVLGGASMGCGTSLTAALDLIHSGEKEKLAGLVLVIPPTSWKTRPAQARKYKVLALLNKLKLIPALLPTLTKNKVIAGFLNKSMPYCEISLQHYMSSHQKEAYHPMLMGSAQSDLPDEEELKKIDVPTLILGWTEDVSHPVSTAKKLRELLPNSEIHLANQARHVDQWDQQINEFLTRLKC